MQYLTVSEVEESTGVSAATVRAMLRDGVLEGYESGGRWLIPDHAVEALEERMAEIEEALDSGENEPEDEDVDGNEDEESEEEDAA